MTIFQEAIFETIQSHVKDLGKIMNKQKKGKDIRFQIHVVKQPAIDEKTAPAPPKVENTWNLPCEIRLSVKLIQLMFKYVHYFTQNEFLLY